MPHVLNLPALALNVCNRGKADIILLGDVTAIFWSVDVTGFTPVTKLPSEESAKTHTRSDGYSIVVAVVTILMIALIMVVIPFLNLFVDATVSVVIVAVLLFRRLCHSWIIRQ